MSSARRRKPESPSGHAVRVLRVGLTGGIATGKSVVAEVFRQAGAFVLDADRLGHSMLASGGPGFAEVRKAFGHAILAPDGTIDRKKLGAVIFREPEARLRLNRILHPLILAEERRRIEEFARTSPACVAVTQAALLVEAGAESRYDFLVVTHCPPEIQLQRLRQRDGISEEEAKARLRAQARPEAKIAKADYVIDTSGDLESTRSQAREVFRSLKEKGDARQSRYRSE